MPTSARFCLRRHLIRLFACGKNPPSPRGEGYPRSVRNCRAGHSATPRFVEILRRCRKTRGCHIGPITKTPSVKRSAFASSLAAKRPPFVCSADISPAMRGNLPSRREPTPYSTPARGVGRGVEDVAPYTSHSGSVRSGRTASKKQVSGDTCFLGLLFWIVS